MDTKPLNLRHPIWEVECHKSYTTKCYIEAPTQEEAEYIAHMQVKDRHFDWWDDPEYNEYAMREPRKFEEVEDSYPILTSENKWMEKDEYYVSHMQFEVRPRVIEGQQEIPF